VAVAADAFKLDYYVETTEEKPDPKLQPATEPPPAEPGVSVTPAVSGSSSSARSDAPSVKPQLTASTKKTAVKPSTAKPATSKTAPASKDKYLQVMATKNQKQAREEQKRVQSKGFKALIMDVTQKNERLYRVMVGPYKESELSLAQADLKAKGYKETIIR
jgi:cell division septation protein DedD